VRAGDESQNRAGLGAVEDDDRNICGRIDARGNFEEAGGFLSRGG
jgi:hypothetical protein